MMEFFIIIVGECTLIRDGVVVGVRRVGNFVGELKNLEVSGEEEIFMVWMLVCVVGDVCVFVF